MMYLYIFFYTFHDFIFGKFGKKEKFVHTNHYLALSTAVFRRAMKYMIVEIILEKKREAVIKTAVGREMSVKTSPGFIIKITLTVHTNN